MPPAPPIAEVPAPPLDYGELLRLCRIYASIRYETAQQARADWVDDYARLEVVEIVATCNRYLIGTSVDRSRQEVVIRGTTNLKNAFYDVRVHRHWNEELGLYLHSGSETMALALHRDLLPRLDRQCEVLLFGHSLGSAEAVILAMLLQRDGYRVRRVYATGQPKVTDQAGADKYRDLPVVRVVNQNDSVPLLPPSSRAAHTGTWAASTCCSTARISPAWPANTPTIQRRSPSGTTCASRSYEMSCTSTRSAATWRGWPPSWSRRSRCPSRSTRRFPLPPCVSMALSRHVALLRYISGSRASAPP